MARRKRQHKEDKDPEMDMSPMIDMVFLLLVFFIVVSTPMIVVQDPAVDPSVAYNSIDVDEKNGRIVLNVRGVDKKGNDTQGTFTQMDYKTEMTEESEISEYVKEEAEKAKQLGYTPKLHLRGDNDALYKYSKTAIKAAAEAGVDKVIFSVFPFE